MASLAMIKWSHASEAGISKQQEIPFDCVGQITRFITAYGLTINDKFGLIFGD
jgi:hypothetical protein